MIYNAFIRAIKKYQTLHIKALPFPTSCVSQTIPHIFLAFVPDILNILENHIQQLCKADQCLVFFGLQPGSIPITSHLPLTLNRVINKRALTQHACCSLAYLTTTNHPPKKIKTWTGSQSIMVDFTTGWVMDGECYASFVLNEPRAGVLYGRLDNVKLNIVWEKLNVPGLLVA